MEDVKRAIEILQQAERQLKGLMTEATASGNYAIVVQIASLARSLSELAKNPETRFNSRPKRNSPTFTRSAEKRGQSKRKDVRYPRFSYQGDTLIRVAWSRKERKEYIHKTTHRVLQALVAAISEAGKDGRVFQTDDILPIHDLDDGSPIPAYQAYVCIGLLKETGLIDQHGRQGYSVPRISELKGNLDSVLKQLPNK
jgi:hypothetical protein